MKWHGFATHGFNGFLTRFARGVLVVAVTAALTCQVQAQFFTGVIGSGLKTLQDHDLLPPQDQVSPTQATGNPSPPVQRAGDLPKEGPLGPEGGFFKLIHEDEIDAKYPLVHAKGGVEFTDRGYHCWADEVYGNQETNVYTLKGNVRVEGQDESVYGDTVQVDFTHRTFVAENSESTLKPSLTKRLRDNLYVKGVKTYGSEQEIFGEKTATTTCSYPSPHFEIVSERTDVRPGRRVIFRKVKIRILGRTILNLPFLSIPLDERTYNNLPEVGHGTIEGYFIKNRYSFPVGANSVFDTRLDYYSKLGIGIGAGVKYDEQNLRGVINVYAIRGPHPELEIIGSHRQNFGWALLTVDSNYEDNNYLVGSSNKSLNSRAMLFVPQGLSSTRLSFFRSTNSSTGSNSSQQTFAINDTRNWSRAHAHNSVRTTFDVNLSENTTSFTGGQPVHREELDVNFRAVDDFQKASAQLDYIRSIPIGQSTELFTLSDVTPALTFLSDSSRLFGRDFDKKFSFQTQLGYGEYGDPITHGRVSRADFDLSFRNPLKPAKHWNLTYQGEFKQDAYSDNTAQYILAEGTQLTDTFRGNGRFNITYDYMRPYGFTPLQLDRRGETNNVRSDLSFSPFKHMQLGFATGYDFNLLKQHQPTPWQQVGMQALYTLGKYFQARVIETYDATQHDFSSTRFDLTWIPGSTYVSFGAKYDGQRHTLAAANLFVDGFQVGRLRTSVILTYDGYTKRFDAMHYSFMYDLHCAEAVLQILDNPTGFNGGRTIYFFIRLKAFPFDTPFGTGTQGQPIGTGTGRDF